MEKDRNARIIAIVALVLAVAGVSIGFAVLSTNLTIEPIDASVKANNDLFTVYFSSSPNEYTHGDISAELAPSESKDFSGNTITVEDKSTTLKGIGGTFTEPGQSITYHLGVSNLSKLTAYIDTIDIENVADSSEEVVCTAVEDNNNPIDASEMNKVCNNINITIDFGRDSYDYNSGDFGLQHNNAGRIYPGITESVDVTITYDGDATPATGDFKATFGNINLIFSTESHDWEE